MERSLRVTLCLLDRPLWRVNLYGLLRVPIGTRAVRTQFHDRTLLRQVFLRERMPGTGRDLKRLPQPEPYVSGLEPLPDVSAPVA